MALTYSIPGGMVQLSGNQIEIVVTTDALKTSHELAVKVKCAALISPVQIDRKAPVNLSAKFNIQGLVDEPLTAEFDHPAVGKVAAHNALALMVYLEIGEYWDDENGDEQESWTVVPDPMRVLDGQLRQHDLNKLNEQGKSFNSEFIEGGRFLTDLPDNIEVSPTQIVKLWYLSRWAVDTAAVLHMNVTQMTNYGVHEYEDEITEDLTLYSSGLFEFCINPFFFGFNRVVTPQYPILGYKFWLTKKDDGSVISEVRSFKVINTYVENQFFGYYRNKYSAIMSVWFRGRYKEGGSAEIETAYNPLPAGSVTRDASIKTVSADDKRYWELNTGATPRREDIIVWREFLTAKERWLIDPQDPDYLIPVYVEGGEFLLYDSAEDIQNCSFKLIEAHQQ